MAVDVRRYLRATHHIRSESALGHLRFDCPFCGDRRVRGWMHVASYAAGCFNDGCVASPRLHGGVFAWAMEKEGLRSKGAAFDFLHAFYPALGDDEAPAAADESDEDDWCVLPDGTTDPASQTGAEAFAFARAQWGLDEPTWRRFQLRACARGRYAARLVVPVVTASRIVTFTARTYRAHEPKYLAAQRGVDCARDVSTRLYNGDALYSGADVLLVEGPGDVLGLVARATLPTYVPVALFGVALNSARIALLRASQPRSVTVALDATALARAARIATALGAWDLHAVLATWDGAKDAGAGGRLRPLGDSLRVRVAARFGI